MQAMEQPEQRAKRQERDLNKIISLQRRRVLGHNALEAANVRVKVAQKNMEDYLSKSLGNVRYFDGQNVEVSNVDGRRLTLMRHVRTDAHDWSPSYWTIHRRHNNAGLVRLSVKEVGGHVYGNDYDDAYITGRSENGEYLGIWLGPKTVIELAQKSPNPDG